MRAFRIMTQLENSMAEKLRSESVQDENSSKAEVEPKPGIDLKVGDVEIIVLGSGCSTGIPMIACLLDLYVGKGKKDNKKKPCVCKMAMQGDPCDNKNNRLNPSILIRFKRNEDEGVKHILIDAGKTFREAAVRWFPKFKVPSLDAVLLTHEHADAVMGLDDLRMVTDPQKGPLPIFLSQQTFASMKRTFPYLVNTLPVYQDSVKHLETEDEIPVEKNSAWVAQTSWNIISEPSLDHPNLDHPFLPFTIAGLQMESFPVYHGKNYFSLGFMMGLSDKKFVYISDVSEIPEKVLSTLMAETLKIELLIIDGLHEDKNHGTHQSIKQVIQYAKMLKPERTYIIGMAHKIIHEPMNKKLSRMKALEGLDIQLAYDGQCIPLSDVEF